MSKSRGNVVNPDDIVRDYGADTMRLYEMFIGDFEQAAPWNTQSIKGCKRFLERFYNLLEIVDGNNDTPELDKVIHKLIKKVTEDIDSMKFNTAIAAMMGALNTIYEVGRISKNELTTLAKLLSPFACRGDLFRAWKFGTRIAGKVAGIRYREDYRRYRRDARADKWKGQGCHKRCQNP